MLLTCQLKTPQVRYLCYSGKIDGSNLFLLFLNYRFLNNWFLNNWVRIWCCDWFRVRCWGLNCRCDDLRN